MAPSESLLKNFVSLWRKRSGISRSHACKRHDAGCSFPSMRNDDDESDQLITAQTVIDCSHARNEGSDLNPGSQDTLLRDCTRTRTRRSR
jgi:hypothetical protein